MYSAEAFRSKLEVIPSEISTRDASFLREMLAVIERESEHLYSAGRKRYRLNLVGAALTPHGGRQTLRVRVAFQGAEGEQYDGQEESDLERITFTYTFSPQRSPEANLRHFRRYIAQRAVALAGVKPILRAASTRIPNESLSDIGFRILTRLIPVRGSVIATATYGLDSPETAMAMAYRRKYVGATTYRGYRRFGDPLVRAMHRYAWLTPFIKTLLIMPCIQAMRAELGQAPWYRSLASRLYLRGWLMVCRQLGRKV